MTVKNFFKITSVILFIAFAAPVKSMASMKASISDSAGNARILSVIVSRVTEIQKMDKANLGITEKKELKKELMAMKHKAEGLDKRIYLSVGAIILIILLLILIL